MRNENKDTNTELNDEINSNKNVAQIGDFGPDLVLNNALPLKEATF